jgi:putative membrane protein
MKSFLKRGAITGIGLLAARIVPGINYTPEGWLLATFILTLLNHYVRPVMVILTLPLLIFTLGLFVIVINAALLWSVGHLLKNNFTVESFPSAVWGSLIIGFISLVLNSLTKSGENNLQFHRGKPPPHPPKDDGGPIIDI